MTEKRSIRDVVRESVGLASDATPAPSPTQRGPGGTMPVVATQQLRGRPVKDVVRQSVGLAAPPVRKAAVQKSEADAAAMAAVVVRSFNAIADRLDLIARKLDAQQVQRAQTTVPPAAGNGYGVPNFGHRLPVPKTGGPHVGNVQTPVLRAMIQRSLGHRL